VIQSPDELLDVLDERFGLSFPPGTRFPCDALDWPAPAPAPAPATD
jgi:hypothetical protein